MKKRFLVLTIVLLVLIAGFVAVRAANGIPVKEDDPILQQLKRVGAADAEYCGVFEDEVTPGTYYKLYQSKDTGFEYRLEPDADYIQNAWYIDQDQASQGEPVTEEAREKNASDFFNSYMADYRVGEYQIENAYDHVAFHTYHFIEVLDGMETGTRGTVICENNGLEGEILPSAGAVAPLSAQAFPETVTQETAAQTALEAARQDAEEQYAAVVAVPDAVEGQLKASGNDRFWAFDFRVAVREEGGLDKDVGYRIWIDAATGELYQLYRTMN